MTVSFPYGHTTQKLMLSDGCVQAVLAPVPSSVSGSAQALVEQALDHPFGSPCLESLAQGREKIVLIASDHTRPVPNRVLLPAMLRRIRAGNPDAQICILVATGCHRATTQQELISMFGAQICRQEHIVVHNCDDEENLVDLGCLPSGGRCRVNRLAAQADLLVAAGFIEPHFFAGFSGGRKSILPGIAARETVVYNHCAEFIDSPYARTGVLQHNPIHEDMLWAARRAGLTFILNVVVDPAHEITAAFAGEPEQTHLHGCAFCEKISTVYAKPADIVVVSNGGYPLDQNIYQAVKGMCTAEAAVKPGGVIIMLAQACDGVGGDYFFRQASAGLGYAQALAKYLRLPREKTEPDQWQTQIFLRVLHKARVILVSSAPEETVRALGMIPAANLETAYSLACSICGAGATVNLIPDGVSVIVKPQVSGL